METTFCMHIGTTLCQRYFTCILQKLMVIHNKHSFLGGKWSHVISGCDLKSMTVVVVIVNECNRGKEKETVISHNTV